MSDSQNGYNALSASQDLQMEAEGSFFHPSTAALVPHQSNRLSLINMNKENFAKSLNHLLSGLKSLLKGVGQDQQGLARRQDELEALCSYNFTAGLQQLDQIQSYVETLFQMHESTGFYLVQSSEAQRRTEQSTNERILKLEEKSANTFQKLIGDAKDYIGMQLGTELKPIREDTERCQELVKSSQNQYFESVSGIGSELHDIKSEFEFKLKKAHTKINDLAELMTEMDLRNLELNNSLEKFKKAEKGNIELMAKINENQKKMELRLAEVEKEANIATEAVRNQRGTISTFDQRLDDLKAQKKEHYAEMIDKFTAQQALNTELIDKVTKSASPQTNPSDVVEPPQSNPSIVAQPVKAVDLSADSCTKSVEQMKGEIKEYAMIISEVDYKDLQIAKRELEAKISVMTCKLELINKEIKKQNQAKQKAIEASKGAGLKKELNSVVKEIVQGPPKEEDQVQVQTKPTIIVLKERGDGWIEVKNKKSSNPRYDSTGIRKASTIPKSRPQNGQISSQANSNRAPNSHKQGARQQMNVSYNNSNNGRKRQFQPRHVQDSSGRPFRTQPTYRPYVYDMQAPVYFTQPAGKGHSGNRPRFGRGWPQHISGGSGSRPVFF